MAKLRYVTTWLAALLWVTAMQAGVLQFPRSSVSHVGVVVRDLATGTDLVSENAEKMLCPASITKCFTAAASLLNGNGPRRFETPVAYSGSILGDTVILGDIIIYGNGDPTIHSPNFPADTLFVDRIVNALKQKGITRIYGNIVIDSIGFPNQGPIGHWELDDLRWSYGAGLYPINFRDNTEERDRAMLDPADTFICHLETAMNDAGITVAWEDVQPFAQFTTPLTTGFSPTNEEILKVMMHKSNNLYAESMLRALKPGGSLADALQTEYDLLKGLGLDSLTMQLYDGSGLTRANRLTPQNMADLLQSMAASGVADDYVALFPRAGMEGTVRRLLAGTKLAGKLVLKSGSMNGVQCFAGYKIDEAGKPTHVVVIMVNDFVCKRATLRNAITKFLLKQFS